MARKQFLSVARRASRRHASGDRELVWTSLISAAGVVSTTPIGFDIVEPVDWERSSVAQEHATLVRIRGSLALSPLVAESQYNAVIIVINSGRGTPDPSSAQVLVDEDILWTFADLAAVTITGQALQVNIDVKSKRKITSSTDVRMVEVCDTTSGYASTYVLRGLLAIK